MTRAADPTPQRERQHHTPAAHDPPAPSAYRPATRPTIHSIHDAVALLGGGPLHERELIKHVWPLFSRVSNRAELYLANHSLGRPLDRMAQDVQHALDIWYDEMDAVWSDRGGDGGWLDAINRYRSLVAQLIGCPRGDAVVPKTAAGQGVRAVLNAISDRGRVPNVVATRNEFDSTDFILKTYAAKGRANVRWVEPSRTEQHVPLYAHDDIIDAIDEQTDLVIVSHIFFNTGQLVPNLADIARAAHDRGAMLLLDTYHSAGVLPLALMNTGEPEAEPDFAVGGNYKYTRGGAGACWLAVHPNHLSDSTAPDLSTLDTGWFAKNDTFAYRRPDRPELSPGGDAWLESTPPVLTAYQALAGLEFTLAVGVDRLRQHNLEQQRFLRDAMRARGLEPVETSTMPGGEHAYAAFTMLHLGERANDFANALRTHGVNTDCRAGFVRFGPDILNTTAELEAAAETTASAHSMR